MLKFSANISMMWTEITNPIDRIKAAKDAGFDAVELIFIYDLSLDDLISETERSSVAWSVVNIAVGEGVKMGPLVGATPGKESAFRENLSEAKRYCKALKPAALVVPAYTPPQGISKQ